MDYVFISKSPNQTIDNLFKRLLIKLIQLYDYDEKTSLSITREIQMYRNKLEKQDNINVNGVMNGLKKFDEAINKIFNVKQLTKPILIKQLKHIYKIQNREFNDKDFEDKSIEDIHNMNKTNYDLLNEEQKILFIDTITVNKKYKQLLKILNLWIDTNERILRNTIRQEINTILNNMKSKNGKLLTQKYVLNTKPNQNINSYTSSTSSIKSSIQQQNKDAQTIIKKFEEMINYRFEKDKLTPELIKEIDLFEEQIKKNSIIIKEYQEADQALKPSYLEKIIKLINDNIITFKNLVNKQNEQLKILKDKQNEDEQVIRNEKVNEFNKKINEMTEDTSIIEKENDIKNEIDKSKELTDFEKQKFNEKIEFQKERGKEIRNYKIEEDMKKFIRQLIIEDKMNKMMNPRNKSKLNQTTFRDLKGFDDFTNNKKREAFIRSINQKGDDEVKKFKQIYNDMMYEKVKNDVMMFKNKLNDVKSNEELDKFKNDLINYEDKIKKVNYNDSLLLFEPINELKDKTKYRLDELSSPPVVKEEITEESKEEVKEDESNKEENDKKDDDDTNTEKDINNVMTNEFFNDKQLKGGFLLPGLLVGHLIRKIAGKGDHSLTIENINPIVKLLKNEKDNDKIDSYLYALIKIDNEGEDDDKIKVKFNKLLYDYDKLERPNLFKQRQKENYYSSGSFSPVLLSLVPAGLNLVSSLINKIKGKGCQDMKMLDTKKGIHKTIDDNKKGGAVLTLQELEQLKDQC